MRLGRLAGLAAVAVIGLSSSASAAPSPSAVAVRRALTTIIPEVKLQGSTLADSIEFLRDITGANLHVNWRALEAAGIGKDTPLNIRLRDVHMGKVLRTVLTEASPSVPLTYYASEGVIEVTTVELADQQMITKVYPVDDLLMEIPDFTEAPDFSLQNTSSSSGGGGGGRGSGSRGGGGGGGGGGLLGGSGGSGGGSREKEKTTTKTERADALVKLVMETVRPEIWRDNGGTASIRYHNGHLIVTAPRSVHEAIGGPIGD
ncbi:MAG TPA: hypothetical protein VEA69_23315 [Tepidisphaeraceae bacterium]|nr:hypothetical protein [Tepidisphaeraceae bacterium]